MRNDITECALKTPSNLCSILFIPQSLIEWTHGCGGYGACHFLCWVDKGRAALLWTINWILKYRIVKGSSDFCLRMGKRRKLWDPESRAADSYWQLFMAWLNGPFGHLSMIAARWDLMLTGPLISVQPSREWIRRQSSNSWVTIQALFFYLFNKHLLISNE